METPWQTKCKNLKSRMGYMFKSQEMTDCTFALGLDSTFFSTNGIRAHKLILAAASPVFHSMLYGELQSDNIEINDVDYNTFYNMLKYIYTDDINIKSFQDGCNLYTAADKYMLDQLKIECMKYLKIHLNADNCCYGFEFAKLYNETEMMANCIKLFKSETSKVLSSDSFEEASFNTVETMFSDGNLNISSELELFNALERYVDAKDKKYGVDEYTLYESFQPALHQIRFLTMTPAEFSKGPARSRLLSQADRLAIFINISNGGQKDYPLPPGFTTETTKRRANTPGQTANAAVTSSFVNSYTQARPIMPTSWRANQPNTGGMHVSTNKQQHYYK